MESFLISFASAVLATSVGSFSGGGSGLILFPLILLGSSASYTSSLAIVKASAFFLTLISSNSHRKNLKINIPFTINLIVWSLAGMVISLYILSFHFNEDLFKQILGICLIVSALILIKFKEKGLDFKKEKKITPKLYLITGLVFFLINIVNGLFGGLGLLYILALIFILDMTFISALAYTMIAGIFFNGLQALYLLYNVEVNLLILFAVLLGSIIGSLIGTKFIYFKGNTWVRVASISMLIVLGLNMLL